MRLWPRTRSGSIALGAGVGAGVGILLAALAVRAFTASMTEHTAPFFGGLLAQLPVLVLGGAGLGALVAACFCFPVFGLLVLSVAWLLVIDALAGARIGVVRDAPDLLVSARLDVIWALPVVLLVNATALGVYRWRGRRAPAAGVAAALVVAGAPISLLMIDLLVPGSILENAYDPDTWRRQTDVFTWERMIPAGVGVTCAWLVAAAFSLLTRRNAR